MSYSDQFDEILYFLEAHYPTFSDPDNGLAHFFREEASSEIFQTTGTYPPIIREVQEKGATVAVLNRGQPAFITFMGLVVFPDTPYNRAMKKQEAKGKNRSLTPSEIVEQTARMVELLNFQTTVGVYGTDIHTYCINPVSIGAVKITERADITGFAKRLRTEAFVQGLSEQDWTDIFLSE
jgi:hypothetical protein